MGIFILKKHNKSSGNEEPPPSISGSADGKSRINKIFFDVLEVGLPAIAILIIMLHVIAVTTVMSGSMEPKLKVATTAIYDRLAYINKDVQRGDIILFDQDERGVKFAKRVIGIGGDTISFQDGYVLINGQRADESAYLSSNIETFCDRTFTVPDGCVFVMGDNRHYSWDSRYFKNPYISKEKIIGKYMGSIGFSIRYYINRA